MVDSFDQMKLLNDAVSKGDYSNRIVHYTSEDKFQKIIESRELWFGRIDQMNDVAEFSHFADAVREVAYQLVPQAPAEIVGMLLDKFERELRDETYISSWCEYDENEPEGRLLMWNMYGDNAGGVAAVVDSSEMQPSTITAPRFNFFVFTSQVEYVKKNEIGQTAALLIERIQKSGALRHMPEAPILLGSMLMARAPTSKHQAFKEEQEVRFLTMPKFLRSNGRFVPDGRIRTDDKRQFFSLELKNWTEFDIDLRLSSILKNVLIGPRNNPEARAARIRNLLDHNGLKHVPVSIVDVPLRDA